MEWPADKVERRPTDALVPYARNARTHSLAQIEQIIASIEEFGWTAPILIDERGGIIAGHGRVLAAKEMGLDEVPVMLAAGWSDAQKRAYVLADNQIALNAGWDEELLRAELGSLAAEGFALDLLGFGDERLGDHLDSGLGGLGGSGGGDGLNGRIGSLADRFGVAPFTVLNAREGWWQDRKRAWLALGIRSELGRGENLLAFSETMLEPDPEKRAAKAKTGKASGQAHPGGSGSGPRNVWKGRKADGSTAPMGERALNSKVA